MVFVEHTVSFKGNLESAWEKLVDWKHMRDWDIFIDDVVFEGPLEIGSKGQLKTRDGFSYLLQVTDLKPQQSYVDEFTTMGSTFVFNHEISEKTPGEITMRFTISAKGLIATIFKYPINNALEQKLPILMGNFKQQYEESLQQS